MCHTRAFDTIPLVRYKVKQQVRVRPGWFQLRPEAVMKSSDKFTDPRDGTSYDTFIDDSGVRWLGNNLRFAHQLSNPLDSYNNDNEHGRLYSHDAAVQSVPSGWRLPTVRDWRRLEKELDRRLFGFPPSELRLRGSGHYYWTSSSRLNLFAKCPPGSMYHIAFTGGPMSIHSDWVHEHFLVRCVTN